MIKNFEQFILDSYNGEFLNFIEKRSNLFQINESQESKSQSDAIKLLMNKLGWDKEKANNFVRVDLRNDITPLRDKQIGKFTLGVTRMFIDGELKDANKIGNLNATLKLLSAHLNEYDRNLNGLSVDELISKFENVRKNNVKKEKQKIDKIEFGISNYDIVKIDSYSDAKKYYKYTNPHSRWCLTYMENMYDSYTCNGINQIYFCLRKGFEDVKQTVGRNTPLDDYGISMLSIIINEYGELAYCTCRWNHDNGGTDSVMDAVEISKIVNVDFYETFKPNSKWKDMIDDIKNKLANGESIENVFDEVSDLKDGYIRVKLNGKSNFINTKGELLSKEWFDEAYDFKNGYAKVSKKVYNEYDDDDDDEYEDENDDMIDRYNFINTKGELLSKEWFDEAYDFKNGYAKVKLDNLFNFININGKYLSKDWFRRINYLNHKDGLAIITKTIGHKENIINHDYKFLFDEWFDYISIFDIENGIVKVNINNKYNLININSNLPLLNDWVNEIDIFKDGVAKVRLIDKYNFINKKGEYLFDKWISSDEAKEVSYFENGYALIKKLNGKSNFINKKGEYLFDEWFDNAFPFSKNGYALVKLNNKYNFINSNGKYLSDEWFDETKYGGFIYVDDDFDYVMVKLNNKYNFINSNGKYLSDEWFDNFDVTNDMIRVHIGGGDYHVMVKLNNKYNFINSNGKYLSDKWFDDKYDAEEYYYYYYKKIRYFS